mmetsp:Transcript_25089/g.69376  ORF Transcript_25089/g.69376 Transcript_25089/m.69376 type:complete len:209 (-) Transcript_25089:212-838(-)
MALLDSVQKNKFGIFFSIGLGCRLNGIAKGNFEFIGIHAGAKESVGNTVGQSSNGREGQLQIHITARSSVAQRVQLALEGLGAFLQFFRLLSASEFRGRRASFQHGYDSLAGRFVRQRQIEGRHPIIILQVQGVGVSVDEQADNLGRGLVGSGHVQGQTSILVSNRGTFGVFSKQQLHRVSGGLPHGSLMNGQIACRVGLTGTARVGS